MVLSHKVVLSDKGSCNNGKDRRYIVGYQVDGETIIPLFIKTFKSIFSYGVSQHEKNSAYTMSLNVSLNVSEVTSLSQQSGCLSIEKFGIRLSQSYLKSWQPNF